MSTVITLACMAALAGFVYWYMPRDRPRKRFRLEQFRPTAPLVGILDENRGRGGAVDAVDDPDTPPSSDRSSVEALD